MIDILFALIALAIAIIVILAWRHVHRQHLEAHRSAAEQAAKAEKAGEAEKAVEGREGPRPAEDAEAEEADKRAERAERPPTVAAVPERVVPPVPTTRDGWSVPKPLHVPRPMYWPAFLAIGVVWGAWGAISSPLLIYAGIAVFIVALTLWIREMLHAE